MRQRRRGLRGSASCRAAFACCWSCGHRRSSGWRRSYRFEDHVLIHARNADVAVTQQGKQVPLLVLPVEEDLALRLGSDLRVDRREVGPLAGSEVERVDGALSGGRLEGLGLGGGRGLFLVVLGEHD